MGVTAKNFFQSYYKKERLPTVEYPEEKSTVTQFSRNFPFLVFDGDDPIDGMRCTACTLCEKACPPACIYIIKDQDENGKPLKRPRIFDIDSSVCMSCQLCVEACPYEAIRMDSEFELSTENRFEGLMVNRKELLKSNEYYHEIHPIEAQVTDDRMTAKAEAAEAKKREREEIALIAAAAKKAAAEKAAADQAAEPAEAAPAPEVVETPKAEDLKAEAPTPAETNEAPAVEKEVAPPAEVETQAAEASDSPEKTIPAKEESMEPEVSAETNPEPAQEEQKKEPEKPE